MTKKSSHTHKLVIPSQTERLKDVRQFVADLAQGFGFGEDDSNKIILAVDEACTNVIKHAYGYKKNNSIRVEVAVHGSAFEISITDYGKPFDPALVSKPDMKEYLTKFKRGGLGMYLMRTVMDKVEYDFKPGPVNCVRLTKYLPGNVSS